MSRMSLTGGVIVSLGLAACAPVVQAPAASALRLDTISPQSGPVGTLVRLSGSGFLEDNTVLFGAGAGLPAHSDNGATLDFLVPGVVNPACFDQGCRVLSQGVRAGRYDVSVRNANGVSNALSFTVR